MAFLGVLGREWVEVVVICQFFANKNAVVASEQSHAWLPVDYPLLDAAIWLTRVIDKACHGTTSSVDNHTLLKFHEIVALTLR